MNAFPVPVSGSAFSLRLEPPLAKPVGSTTHTKKRLEKAFVLFLNKSIKQTIDVTNYILSIFKRSVSLTGVMKTTSRSSFAKAEE